MYTERERLSLSEAGGIHFFIQLGQLVSSNVAIDHRILRPVGPVSYGSSSWSSSGRR